jgi:hypothetical protein
MRMALLAIALLACGRDLTLPVRLQPPQLASVAPTSAFAGEQLILRGANLGAPADARVFVGGTAASVQLTSLPDGALAVLVPELATVNAPLDVSIANPQGHSSLPLGFTYLGLGHPHSLSLRGSAQFTPILTSGTMLGGTAFLVDGRRHLLLVLDPISGSLLGSRYPRIPDSALFAFGPPDSPWVFSAGEVGKPPNLHRFDFSVSPPAEKCPAPSPPGGIELDVGTSGSVGNASGSTDGKLLALPVDDVQNPSVALVDLSTCTPALRRVSLPGAASAPISAALIGGGEAIAFTKERVYRVPASGAAIPGDLLPAGMQPAITPALDPANNRLAFTNDDADVAFVTWPGPGGAPAVSLQKIVTFEGVDALAFNEDGSRLFVATSHAIAYDPSTLAPVGSSKLGTSPNSISPMPGGAMLVAEGNRTAVLGPGAFVLRENDLGVFPTGVAVGTSGRAYFANSLDTAAVLPQQFIDERVGFNDTWSMPFDGAASSEGGAVAWSQNVVYLRDEDASKWRTGPTLAAGRQIVSAARASDGSVAVYSTTDSDSALDLFPAGASHSSASRTDPAGSSGALLFDRGVLWALTGKTGSFVLIRFSKAGLAGSPYPLGLPYGSTDPARIVGLWPSHALSGVLAVIGLLNPFFSNGELYASTATLVTYDGLQADVGLGVALVHVMTLSADGSQLLVGSHDPLGVNAGRLSLTGDKLEVTVTDHQDLPDFPFAATPSLEGDRYYIMLGRREPAAGLLQ